MNPESRQEIPDELTEEEMLLEAIKYYDTTVNNLTSEIYRLQTDREEYSNLWIKSTSKLIEVRAENAAFLKSYAPDAIGSAPEDTFTDDTCSRTMNKETP